MNRRLFFGSFSESELVAVTEPCDCPLCGCPTLANAVGHRVCPECSTDGGTQMPAVLERRMKRGLGIPRDVH